jgi:hypothetical protein
MNIYADEANAGGGSGRGAGALTGMVNKATAPSISRATGGVRPDGTLTGTAPFFPGCEFSH